MWQPQKQLDEQKSAAIGNINWWHTEIWLYVKNMKLYSAQIY